MNKQQRLQAAKTFSTAVDSCRGRTQKTWRRRVAYWIDRLICGKAQVINVNAG
ncbi:hypothetical protein FLM9_1362 [Candidatus Synechococcus spongiarum]|uniref:Uncharacterized protein n=1 Tax=Candidatus Synechococcus spongiarum TaxID=431041 RepID=A0A165B1Q2_9SYNE|nr:hypothetical protein FLM9_1362 [Candidatus Synechococcus spongiarum]